MMRALTLQDFGHSDGDGLPSMHAAQTGPTAQDEDRLAAFDAGYKGGWDDCIAAEAEGRAHIGADLARALTEITLTHADARRDVLRSLTPLFDQIIHSLLPTAAAAAVGPVLNAELAVIAERATTAAVELLAAPAACAALEHMASAHPGMTLTVRPEPAFAEGQISIRFAGDEREIDLGQAIARMAEAIRSFTDEMSTVPQNAEVA